jgi:hypothetical protein
MSPPPTSSTAFVTLTLGRSANAIELSVPPAPAAHAASDLKARSFDFLADLLTPHAALYSSAELFAAFAGHFPTSAYNATLEAGHICDALRSAFFHVDHLTALGFRSHDGTPMSKEITADTSNRPAGISYFAFFRSTVHPVAINPRLSSIPSHSFEFWLELPQTLLPRSASSAPSDAATARKELDFATPQRKFSVNNLLEWSVRLPLRRTFFIPSVYSNIPCIFNRFAYFKIGVLIGNMYLIVNRKFTASEIRHTRISVPFLDTSLQPRPSVAWAVGSHVVSF